jgi:hypothetical protein
LTKASDEGAIASGVTRPHVLAKEEIMIRSCLAGLIVLALGTGCGATVDASENDGDIQSTQQAFTVDNSANVITSSWHCPPGQILVGVDTSRIASRPLIACESNSALYDTGLFPSESNANDSLNTGISSCGTGHTPGTYLAVGWDPAARRLICRLNKNGTAVHNFIPTAANTNTLAQLQMASHATATAVAGQEELSVCYYSGTDSQGYGGVHHGMVYEIALKSISGTGPYGFYTCGWNSPA